MKKVFLPLIFLLLLSCSSNRAKWTILIYMAADNSLNDAAVSDIEEMMEAEFSEELNVIVQIDYSECHDEFYTGARRFRIFPGNRELISSPGEIDSGNPAAISEFANWGFSNFFSENKALVIWSHGNGWYDLYNRFCPDNESSSSIDIPGKELRNCFRDIHHNIDILILDACNMQNMETISEIADRTDLIISSEDIINDDGFPYGDIEGKALLSIWEDYSDPQAVAMAIANSFYESYLPGGSQNLQNDNLSVSCSVMNASRLDDLLSKLQNFSDTFSDQNYFARINAARLECLEFNDFGDDVDIREFFLLLKEESESDSVLFDFCEEMIAVIDSAFPEQKYYNYLGEVGTASIWFPKNEDNFHNLRSQYAELSITDHKWLDFLDNYFAENSGKSIADLTQNSNIKF